MYLFLYDLVVKNEGMNMIRLKELKTILFWPN